MRSLSTSSCEFEQSGNSSREESLSPQTPLDAGASFVHNATANMNYPPLQPPLYSQNYSLPTQPECIDHLQSYASNNPYTNSGVHDQIRRESSDLGVPFLNGNGIRSHSQRTSSHDTGFHTGSSISDSGTGSVSTSPGSNASSLAFSSSIYPPAKSTLSLASPYPSATQVPFSPLSYSQPFNGGLSNIRNSISSITHPTSSGLLPSTRPSGLGGPVSPTSGNSIRDAYTTAIPGFNRLNRPYNPLTETPRSILSTASMSLSPEGTYNSSSMGYQSGSDPRDPNGGTPPFAAQEDFHDIVCNGQAVKPAIEANIEKGFFYSNDQCWTCYRRNYFSVQCSYTLSPHLGNQTLFLSRAGGRGQEQIQAMAMTLSAAVDGATGKTIELIQHTPKRDKGPQTAIQMTKLAPTPPGGKFAQLADHSYSHGLASYGHSTASGAVPQPSPYLPLQNAQDQSAERDQTGYANQDRSPSAHQHTFERIQFKSATANNGKRRAQQQYYHLIVELYADVRTDSSKNANWVKIAQRASSQVVVRGRSPSHYSNEGPHSAASRGSGSGGSSMGPMGGSGMGGGGSGSLGLSRGIGQSYGYSSVSGGYRGTQYMLEPMHTGSISSSSSGSMSGVVDAFPPNPRKPYILTSNDDDRHDMDSGYEYYPRAMCDSILPPPIKVESQRLEMERIKDEGLFGPGSMFHQTSRGVYNADPVY